MNSSSCKRMLSGELILLTNGWVHISLCVYAEKEEYIGQWECYNFLLDGTTAIENFV